MGVPVSTFDEFQKKLELFQDRSVIFGFLLYDSRPSQKVLEGFTQNQEQWIDDLARASNIYFFFPFRKKGKDFRNPSPELIRLFDLGLDNLPGIILFGPPRKDGKVRSEHAVYLPLEESDFDDHMVYEPIFIDLFGLISEALKKTQASHEALQLIKKDIDKLLLRKTGRGFADYLRKGTKILIFELPKALYRPFAEGFGKVLGEKAAGA